MDFLLNFLGVMAWGAMGTATSLFRFRVAGMAGEQPTSDDRVAYFFYGLFWPVGIFIVAVAYFTTPRLVKPDKNLTKAQRERERRLLSEREDMRLDAMEADNLLMSRQMRQRMELESGEER